MADYISIGFMLSVAPCELWECLKHTPHLHFSQLKEDSVETPDLDALREERGRCLLYARASAVQKKDPLGENNV